MAKTEVIIGSIMKLGTRTGRIATEPMENQQVKAKVSDGFATAGQRSTLTPLRVVVAYPGSATVPPLEAGALVYVRSECFAQAWAKKAYEVGTGEGKFDAIFVPEDEVMLYLTETR